ncbi:MAG TPA: ABC transporter ATP-binding protein [Thermodesulfobacteriaceae bacterium]|nr:ABC transporter ATP-binding protein [Thermodesulfobacteriaceae bacterium]
MALIELQNIYFQYPNCQKVLEGVNFSLDDGEKIGLLGGNGAGKTTLFHLILGLLVPDQGRVSIFGGYCGTETDFRKIRPRIGLLFQDPDDQLFCPSVIEDVAFGPLNMGMAHADARRRAVNTLESLGIRHLMDRVPYHLSGGEKRLVSVAAVLSMRPEVLLLDEPTTGLDQNMTDRLIGVLHEYPAKAWIVISHDQRLIDGLTEKNYLLDCGRVVSTS